jgi:hypothetical protein
MGVPSIDTTKVQELGDRLVAGAGDVRAGAGGVDRADVDVPYDWFGLTERIVRLDEARQAFDERLAAVVGEMGERALKQVFDAAAADDAVLPLPWAGR